MSHEIRTPIHGILGLAELMREERLSPLGRQYVEAISRSGQMLSSVVSDILDYSKIEAGALDLDEASFSIAAVIEDVFGLMLPLAARKPDLHLNLQAPRFPPMVGDEGKLRQILINLVGNAVKFTERGEIRLTVAELPAGAGRLTFRFDVVDTGIGIAEDKLGSIFDPFTQSDGSIARRYGGSGLGLAICRRLVERLDGEIGVESRNGKGSRFWFTSTFERSAADAPSRHAEMTADLVSMPLSLDVLVVEDNEVNAMVACGLLERIGHRATLAPTGEAAVEQVRAHDFDVVLMDLRLPDIDGLEATKRIRALTPRQKRLVPIIALSAQVAASDVEACLKAGVDEFLGKPFRPDRLEASLRRAVLGRERPKGARPLKFHRQEIPAAQPQSEASVQPFDVTVLAGHMDMLGLDQTARIVAAFESSIAGVPEEIEHLAAVGDRSKLVNAAHRLKSSSLHVGLLQLSKDAAALEGLARNGDDNLAASAGTLAVDCRDGLAILKRCFAELAAGQPANT